MQLWAKRPDEITNQKVLGRNLKNTLEGIEKLN